MQIAKNVPQGERPKVLLAFDLYGEHMDLVIELAEQWGWDVLSLRFLGGLIPEDIPFSGALVSSLPDEPIPVELRKRRIPAVRLGERSHPLDQLLPAVVADLESWGILAAEHLAERGFKDLAFVSYNASNPLQSFHTLLCSFRKRAEELGVRYHQHDYVYDYDLNDLPTERLKRRSMGLAEFIRDLPKPVGVFTIGDPIAGQLLRMCSMENIKVPEDMAVLGRGNSRECLLSLIPLSSLDTAKLQRTRQALRLLKRIMNGRPAPKAPIFVPAAGVIGRKSTDVLAVKDKCVADALEFLWSHIEQDPSVNDVAAAIGTNRRTLERLFKKELGRGVNAEMRRRRLVEFCRLLRSSDEPLSDLSVRVGYKSQESMHRHFRDAMGLTPREYRKQVRSSEAPYASS